MKSRFATAEVNVDRISGELEKHKITLLKDVAVMDQMYERNLQYFKELTMYILAGKKKLAAFRANELQQAMDKAKAMKKAGELTEDTQKTMEEDVQKLTDKYIKNIDAAVEEKQKEIMAV